MPLYFTSKKDRLGFATKCNHPKFIGAKHEFLNWIYDVREHSYVMDTGATLHITTEKEDLYNFFPSTNAIELKGIAHGLKILGYGFTLGRVIDTQGIPRVLPLQKIALVEKQASTPPLRIVSPQAIAQSSERSVKFEVDSNTGLLVFYDKDGDVEYEVLAPYTAHSNLPVLQMLLADYDTQRALEMQVNAVPIPTLNLTRKQELLLEHHRRLRHRNMQDIQELARSGKFGLPKDIANCPIPKCADCQLGSNRRGRRNRISRSRDITSRRRINALTPTQLRPKAARPPWTRQLVQSKRKSRRRAPCTAKDR